jgi:hypothetical protein
MGKSKGGSKVEATYEYAEVELAGTPSELKNKGNDLVKAGKFAQVCRESRRPALHRRHCPTEGLTQRRLPDAADVRRAAAPPCLPRAPRARRSAASSSMPH